MPSSGAAHEPSRSTEPTPTPCKRCSTRIDHIDHVASFTGEQPNASVADTNHEMYQRAIDARVWAARNLCAAGAPRMPPTGSFTFCSGVSAWRPRANRSAGAAATAAPSSRSPGQWLSSWLRSASTSICPGSFDTPVLDRAFGDRKEEALRPYLDQLPLGRLGQPEELAHAMLFLMTNDYVTGTVLHVDGGVAADLSGMDVMTDPAELVRDVQLPSGDLLIGDRWEADTRGGPAREINPATGEPLASVAMAGPDDVDRAIDRRRSPRSTRGGQWAPQRRRDVLLELARLLDANDCRPRRDAFAGDRRAAASGSEAARWRRSGRALLRRLGRQDRGRDRRRRRPVRPSSYTRPEPYGVVAVLTPWNGGMVSPAMKVAPALAAGNCVVLKPAELAPLGPLRFAELCLEAGVPPGVAQRRDRRRRCRRRARRRSARRQDQLHRGRGDGPPDHGGRSRNLTPVVLELGGKSANVVFADADLDLRPP